MFTIGKKGASGTFSPDKIFDSTGNAICAVYGISLNHKLEELGEADKEGLAIAQMIVDALNAAQQSAQADLLPCGHSADNLGNFGGCNPMGSCVICDAATSR